MKLGATVCGEHAQRELCAGKLIVLWFRGGSASEEFPSRAIEVRRQLGQASQREWREVGEGGGCGEGTRWDMGSTRS